jgi:hypothetical protein
MKRGDTKIVQLTINNLPVTGFTGYSAWFTAKNQVSDTDATAVIKKIPVDFTTIVVGSDVVAAVITCKIVPADTNALPDYDVQLAYDAQVEDGSGNVTTVADGTLTVKADITRTFV